MMRRHFASLIAAATIAACFGVPVTIYGVTPLHRIAVVTGAPQAEFVDTVTGRFFLPEGNNYIHLTSGTESTFNVGLYDSAAAESALAGMQLDQYNVVRVAIEQSRPNDPLLQTGNYGVGGPLSTNVPDLYPAYLANFIDFF